MSEPALPEETILLRALDIDEPEQRLAYLDRACGIDTELRRCVDELLRHHYEGPGFLESPPTEVVVAAEHFASHVAGAPKLDFLTPSSNPSALGRLGPYDILEVLGSGGFGVVLKARDSKLDRIVAIKTLVQTLASSANARRRFVREAKAAAAVNHENVVGIYGVSDEGAVPYLVMECISGVSLERKLQSVGTLDLPAILRIGIQIARGLEAAHTQGLVHRDIKPANILLENGVERVRITDFGLARAADDVGITQAGEVAGTPQYMSPEQAEGKFVDARSDLFSLGSVLYAMCTGRSPFRAESAVAALHRVCADTPRPIREINSEIPQWLIDLIGRLLAKCADDRLQTAGEVADLLGQGLASLQHSAPPPQIRPAKPDRARAAGRNYKPLGIAVAALLAIMGTFTLAEGTGVTQVTATVVRLMTPSGTLVVESHDPNVTVTIAGDGGVAITGAGLREFRLRPGEYRVQADKDGQPVALDRQLVSITRGNREVVNVKLEAEDRPKPSAKAFTIVARGGAPERAFATLSEAARSAVAGATIEIRGNGPFSTEPIALTTPLVVRAAAGFHPVIRLSQEDAKARTSLLRTNASLVIEGIEFQRIGNPIPKESPNHETAPCLIWSEGEALHVSNCRFRVSPGMLQVCVYAGAGLRTLVVRNSLFICPNSAAISAGVPLERRTIANCVVVGSHANGIHRWQGDAGAREVIHLVRNTLIVTDFSVLFHTNITQEELALVPRQNVTIEAAQNIFDAPATLFVRGFPTSDTPLQAKKLLGWRDRGNLFRPESEILSGRSSQSSQQATLKTLDEWKSYWGQPDADVAEGVTHYQGGDLVSKLRLLPDEITADDFRLRADSAGYHAGPNETDLGADVDVVGPGPAYERWKATSAYQEWLRDSGQPQSAASLVATQPFVLLGGAGTAERKFGTLADAVLNSSDGDIVEIRGNGPFETEPLEIKHGLSIRAGTGFRPVIVAGPITQPPPDDLFVSGGRLLLEGIEIHCPPDFYRMLHAQGPLWVANCRFQFTRDGWVCIESFAAAVVRNCELLSPTGAALAFRCHTDSAAEVTNCVLVGHINLEEFDLTRRVVLLFQDSTFVSPHNNVFLHCLHEPALPLQRQFGPTSQYLQLTARNNVFNCQRGMYSLTIPEEMKTELAAAGTEAWTLRRVKWNTERNIYAVDLPLFWIQVHGKEAAPLDRGRNFADWREYWGIEDPGSVEGSVRFQGGNLTSRAATAANRLTPGDFRLRPDSSGFHAGAGGHDLGADVDLVGPGEAYERWKQTPEYQQWLKQSGQKKE